MSTSDPVLRLIGLMTHLNIGAALGMAAWLLASGWQVVTGQIGQAPQRAVHTLQHVEVAAPGDGR